MRSTANWPNSPATPHHVCWAFEDHQRSICPITRTRRPPANTCIVAPSLGQIPELCLEPHLTVPESPCAIWCGAIKSLAPLLRAVAYGAVSAERTTSHTELLPVSSSSAPPCRPISIGTRRLPGALAHDPLPGHRTQSACPRDAHSTRLQSLALARGDNGDSLPLRSTHPCAQTAGTREPGCSP